MEPCKRCWADRATEAEAVGRKLSPMGWVDTRPRATCLLPAGHAGSHVWTPEDDIEVSLPKKGGLD